MNIKNRIPILDIKELNDVQYVGKTIQGTPLLVVKVNEQFNVFQGLCPHQGALLAEGLLEHGQIICPAHQWKFDCVSGEKHGKAGACLKRFESFVENNQLYINEEEFSSWLNPMISEKNAERPEPVLKKFKDLSGPKSWPVVGNLPSILSDMNHLHLTLFKWAEQYGTLYRLKGFMHNQSLVVSDPKVARKILLDRPHAFSRIKSMGRTMEEVGLNGLITAEGELWKKYRKFSTHGLANKVLREYYQIIERSTNRLLNLTQIAANEKATVDIQKVLLRYAVDVTSSLAFGVDINTLENSDDDLQSHLALVLPMVQRRMMIPVPYWKYLKLPIDYKLDNSLRAIKRTVNGFINEARERVKNKPEEDSSPINFIEALLVAKDEEGNHLTDSEISSNVFSILLAGEDSTANSIAWAVHYMTIRPDVQKKMQEEVDQVFGGQTSMATFDQLQQLPYIEAVVQETLRLRPVLPIIQLCANEDVVIENVEVPKGTNIQLPIYNMFLDDENFKNSSEFDPDRWLQGNSSMRNNMQNAFLPFGFGPRVCPGRSLALLENKAALCMISRLFSVTKAPNTPPVEEIFAGLIQPLNLLVNFEKRTVTSDHQQVDHQQVRQPVQTGGCPFHRS